MSLKLPAAALAATLLLGCGADDEEDLTVAVESEPGTVSIEAPAPAHEGTVVMADDMPVEVVTHESGEVYAYVRAEEPPAPDRLGLTVSVPVRGRASGRPVRMVWNERDLRWEGRVRRVEIVPGPVEVVVQLDGEPLRGHADIIVVAPAVHVTVERPAARPRTVIEVVEPRGKVKHRRGHGWGRGRVRVRGKHRRKHRRRGGVEVRFR